MFSQRLRFLRETKGLSQKQAAVAIGVGIATYQRYELGTCEPGYRSIVSLVDYFRVPFDFIASRGNFIHWDWLIEHRDVVCGAISSFFLDEDGHFTLSSIEYIGLLDAYCSEMIFTEEEGVTFVNMLIKRENSERWLFRSDEPEPRCLSNEQLSPDPERPTSQSFARRYSELDEEGQTVVRTSLILEERRIAADVPKKDIVDR